MADRKNKTAKNQAKTAAVDTTKIAQELENFLQISDVPQMLRLFSFWDTYEIDSSFAHYTANKNPLPIWGLLTYCWSTPYVRYHEIGLWFKGLEASYGSDVFNKYESLFQTALVESPTKLELPSWCEDYLLRCSEKMGIAVSNKDLSAQQIKSKVPEFLGFARKGWNAFEDARERQKEIDMFNHFVRLVSKPGSTHAAARSQTMEKFGVQSDRHVQRVIQKIESLSKKT